MIFKPAVLLSILVGAIPPCLAQKPNILFIAVDDLRPELYCYGKTHIKSPNIDKLASRGVLFKRAYCQIPTCGASRASLLTGIRPTSTRFTSYQTFINKDAPDVTTLPKHLKDHGYHTVSNGKITHHRSDIPEHWSEKVWRPKAPMFMDPENVALGRKLAAEAKKKNLKKAQRGPAFESFEAPDSNYPDGMIADKTIADLRRLAKSEKPFFLAAGFMKPHLPFNCPKKYWDLYKAEDLPLASNPFFPKDVPNGAVHNSGELRSGYSGVPKSVPLPDDYSRQLIHGYAACVSFTDAQIGKLLEELDSLDLTKNTIIILWGDHGWNLGDHTMWCKHSCFESSLHVPLIMAGPGITSGKTNDGLTGLIDIFPTFCDLLGLEKPSHLDGISFAPRLKDPSLEGNSAAFSRFGRGDTIRTDFFRFTNYGKSGTMLYDHRNDPSENTNISSSHSKESKDLNLRLQKEIRRTKMLN